MSTDTYEVAKSFEPGTKWGGTTYDPGLHEPAFAYDSDDWGDDAADGDFDE